MAQIDFMINNDNTLMIQNGDFVIDDSTLNHAKEIINVAPGEIRQYPTLGANISKYIGSKIDKINLYNIISEQLTNDNITLLDADIKITNNSIEFDIVCE